MTTQQSAPVGPLVWNDMDQAALDRAYDQSVWAPNQSLIHERRAAAAAEAHARLAPRRLSYGEREIEQFDFYSCGENPAPIVVFIHGGAWRSGTARLCAHLADTFAYAGAHAAILDFASIDDEGGRIETLVDQVRRGVAHVARNARELGGDGRLFVAGHSSGGHLSACVATSDWAEHGLPQNVITGALLMSGMYDLEPVRRSARSRYVNFTDENVAAFSAMRRIDRLTGRVLVAWGSCESPEFQRQGRDFAAALAQAGKEPGKDLRVVEGAGANHFEMLEALHNPFGCVGREFVRLVRGA